MQQFVNNTPVITRYLLISICGVSVLCAFGVLSPFNLLFNTDLTFRNLQLWRILTSHLFVPLNLRSMFDLYFLYTYSSQLEKDDFRSISANYLFFLIFVSFFNTLAAAFHMYPMLLPSLTFSILHLWSRHNRDVITSFLFGVQFKSIYLPWVYMGYMWLTTKTFVPYLCGILSGHLFYFLKYWYPANMQGQQLLHTPRFLINLFPRMISNFGSLYSATGATTSSPPRSRPPASDQRRHFFGQGRRLGDL
ncbi:hypothetical protein GJ496_002624 [Pomphorhynchus laevis]|nr:hypothetical protein GJ496_002624 [Pomphorhynchus laevis]